MTEFELPLPLIDPATLPPPIMTSEPGTFAQHTMAVRVPRIADETAERNTFPPEISAALAGLRDEIVGGKITPLAAAEPDHDLWLQTSAPYLGRSWLDAPWYWAESYFYRRVLQATRYFQPGPWQGFDPFAVTKATEWLPAAAPRVVGALLDSLPADPAARCAALLQASLWGNRIDLSLTSVAERWAADHMAAEGGLLVDDSAAVWRHLTGPGAQPGLVVLIADNAGTELASDLALVDHLLTAGLAAAVELHLKPQPFYVSDATAADLANGLAALAAGDAAAAALAGRLHNHLAAGRLHVYSHWFYASSLFYFELPVALRGRLAAAALVIVKGDANYRRLLGDAHWRPDASFSAAVAYFPAPLLALRTLKSEIAIGLAAGLAERLDRESPGWLVDGSRGVIQARLF